MNGRERIRRRLARVAVLVVLATGLVAIPAAGVPKERAALGDRLALHLSQAVSLRYWAMHPEQAPSQLGARLELAAEQAGTAVRGRSTRVGPGARARFRSLRDLFNADATGLPQNEESITACRSNTRVVLGGTNDFRGLLDPEGNFTGWHFSRNGGRSLTNEGLLPSVALLSDPGATLPSQGDPVDVADNACNLYAGSLAFLDPFDGPNGIAVYRTTPATLASCDTGANPSNPDCWPTRRLVAEAAVVGGKGNLLDKEWIYVGKSGGETVVWVVYSNFTVDLEAPLTFTAAEIEAVRCEADLSSCTDPIPISVDPVNGPDLDVQFGDVTIGQDGRTYVTWSEIIGELPNDPDCDNLDEETGECLDGQTFVHKIRVAEPGSTDFGPEQVVHVEENAIPFGGFLHANDFRVATYPKNEVAMVRGEPRIFVVWDACSFRPGNVVCEEPVIKLSFSDDLGASWSDPAVLSRGGDNYFVTISTDRGRSDQRLAVAWFTNRFDRAFHNQQDVVLTTVNPQTLGQAGLRRLTAPSNESEADPFLGGFFIGDYIEAFAHRSRTWVHYNANYRKVQLLGEGIPVNQQDNFLAIGGAG